MVFLHKKIHFTTFQIIIAGFAGIILTGALLLMLPISSQSGTAASFHDALFTSTSAVCVTGLVVRDTASYWSPFGQAVILLLIQIGGIGFFTWDDIRTNRSHFKRYRMQSKVILVTTLLLILIPFLLFFCFEYTRKIRRKKLLLFTVTKNPLI